MKKNPLLSAKDYSESLEQLEKDYWGIPEQGSYLIMTCCRLRQKPLRDFSVEDYRIMIGQNISLPYLMPLALAELKGNILAAGDFYPGDLLASVLRSDAAFWQKNPPAWKSAQALFREKLAEIPTAAWPSELGNLLERFERVIEKNK